MPFFKLKANILRNHLASNQWYKCSDDNTEHEGVVIGISKSKPWGVIEQSTEPLDVSDCESISHDEYYERYDHADFLMNHSHI